MVWQGPVFWFIEGCVFSLCPHMGNGGWTLWSLSYKSINPIMGALSLWPDYFPKVPPSNTITLGVRISTCELGGHWNSDHYTILKILSLPIHEHRMLFHLFRSFISFMMFCSFHCTSFVLLLLDLFLSIFYFICKWNYFLNFIYGLF